MRGRERRQLSEYLEEVLLFVDRIERYTDGVSFEALMANELLQDGIERNLEKIGEALHQIQLNYSRFYHDHPEIPFRNAYTMRNKLSHVYWKTEGEIIWDSIHEELPELRDTVQSALNSL